jgi:hypothetical protein
MKISVTTWARRAVVCAALAAGCASGPPPKPLPEYFKAGAAEPPRYPRAQYVAGIGSSSSSAVEAQERAKSNAVQQISAQLKVEVDTWAKTTTGGGASQEASQFVERINVRSDFSHGELIRVVDEAQQDSTFYALAVIDRAEAEAALARDVAAEEARFESAARRALAARKERRAGEFSAACDEAQAALPALESSYVLRRALLRRPSAAEAAHVSLRNELVEALVAARARRVVDLRMDGKVNAALLQRAVNAVRKLGLRVAEGRGCDATSAEEQLDATELVLSPEETCGDGSFGPKCEISVRLHARGCAGGGEGEARMGEFRGAHPADQSRALAKAWEKVTDSVVETAVRAALAGTVSAGGVR